MSPLTKQIENWAVTTLTRNTQHHMKKTIGVLLKDIKKQRKTLSSMTDINKYLRNTSTGAGRRPAVGELLK